jgi:hypothetical protein
VTPALLSTWPRAGEVLELRVCGCGASAYFEGVDQLGARGDMFTLIDFAQVEATLVLNERDAAESGASL